jgi:hypothetical protein
VFKLTAVPETDATGIVPEVIEAPDMAGAVENVFVPATVCDVVKSIAVPTTDDIGIVPEVIDAPDKTGTAVKVLIAVIV